MSHTFKDSLKEVEINGAVINAVDDVLSVKVITSSLFDAGYIEKDFVSNKWVLTKKGKLIADTE